VRGLSCFSQVRLQALSDSEQFKGGDGRLQESWQVA
jgi:hypothetical protein